MSQQIAQFIFKLRNNISLEGDVKLAEMEIQAFLPDVRMQPIIDFEALVNQGAPLANFKGLTALTSHTRKSGLHGYMAFGDFNLLSVLICKLSFVQNIYCVVDYCEQSYSSLRYCEHLLGEVIHDEIVEKKLIICAIPHFALIELSEIVARRAKNTSDTRQKLQYMLDGLLDRNANQKALKIAEETLKAQNTTSHLSHDIHYYKAKFFPRLVRSTLNICSQKLDSISPRVIDCFSGSGTTLLEAAMLGMESAGVDIDPLSVLIAKSKIEILQIPSSHLSDEVSVVLEALENKATSQLDLFTNNQSTSDMTSINFPTWLMKNRKMSQEIAAQLISEIQQVRRAVAVATPELQDFFQVLMSDAIARKIKMRFLGTGVGRFSLSFTQKSIPHSFKDSAERYVCCLAAVEWLNPDISQVDRTRGQ
jgi:hypothetical protein